MGVLVSSRSHCGLQSRTTGQMPRTETPEALPRLPYKNGRPGIPNGSQDMLLWGTEWLGPGGGGGCLEGGGFFFFLPSSASSWEIIFRIYKIIEEKKSVIIPLRASKPVRPFFRAHLVWNDYESTGRSPG